jgi:hypothetical protein
MKTAKIAKTTDIVFQAPAYSEAAGRVSDLMMILVHDNI